MTTTAVARSGLIGGTFEKTQGELLIERLQSGISRLPDRDQNFATSLLTQYNEVGRLSDKQLHWVGVLADRACEIASEAIGKPVFGELKKLIDFFNASDLKRPKLLINTKLGQLTITKAGEQSANPGHLYIKRGSAYQGKVTPNGKPLLLRDVDKTDIIEQLQKIADDPVAAAKDFASATGCCCFCGKELTDDRSLAVSYGPVCAAKWHLPWGEKE